MMELQRSFGCKRSKYDPRDLHYMQLEGVNAPVVLPASVDLRPKMPPIYDQGALGSCTANAIAGVCQYDLMHQSNPRTWNPSRLFIYYNERAIEGTVNEDSGASLRDGIQSIHTEGFANETLWPYDISQFKVKPSQHVYDAAAHEKVAIKDYGTVAQNMDAMKTALANGHPIVIGFIVHSSFMSQQVAQTGIVPMPGPNEQVMGGHAVAIVGYDADGWIVRNSWGEGWGQKGYFIMPYQYFTNPQLAWDLWVIRLVP